MCPSEQNLRRYLNGDLGEDERAEIDLHLQVCGHCLEVLQAIVDAAAGGIAAEIIRNRPPAPSAPPPRLPALEGQRFRILRLHAEGGLGRIFIAHDEELGREVALKEIRPDKVVEPLLRSRFILEAQLNGRLEHAGIVPVYSLGTREDGRPFYAMRFVEGDSLNDAIDSYHKTHPRPDPAAGAFRTLLGRFIDVCEVVAFAHSKGVVHRDLNPRNVLLGRFGETLLIDWGLARATGAGKSDGADVALEAMLAAPSGRERAAARGPHGTPLYSSPEQAALAFFKKNDGRLREAVDSLGPATDIYGLGAILFALLTGEPPVEGKTTREILERTRDGAIRLPRSLNPNIPRALESICLKALARQPEDRYPSALALAEDIERFRNDEPVSVHREGPSARLARWTRRHRTLTLAVVAALFLIAVASIGSAIALDRAWFENQRALGKANAVLTAERAALEKAVAATERATVAATRAERQARLAESRRLAALSESVRDRRLDLALLLAVEAVRSEATPEARNSLFRALLSRPSLTTILPAERNGPSALAFSPDGKTLAAACHGPDGGGVMLWNVAQRTRLEDRFLAVPEGAVSDVAFSADGHTLAASFHPQGFSILDAADRRVDHGVGVIVWDMVQGTRLAGRPLAVTEGYVESLAFSPDGKTLAAAYGDSAGDDKGTGGVVLWNVAQRTRLADQPLTVTEGLALGVAFSPDGKTLAAAHGVLFPLDRAISGGGVVLWDLAGRTWLADRSLAVPEGAVSDVAFSPDGNTLAAAYDRASLAQRGGVVLWDASRRTRLANQFPPVTEGPVSSVAFSPDGKTLAAAFHTGEPGPLAAAPHTGQRSGSDPDGGILLWEIAACRRLLDDPLPAKGGRDASVAFSPDGTTLAVSDQVDDHGGGRLVLWDLDLASWKRHAEQIANRNFTRAEWQRYFPDEPYRPTFDNLAVPSGGDPSE